MLSLFWFERLIRSLPPFLFFFIYDYLIYYIYKLYSHNHIIFSSISDGKSRNLNDLFIDKYNSSMNTSSTIFTQSSTTFPFLCILILKVPPSIAKTNIVLLFVLWKESSLVFNRKDFYFYYSFFCQLIDYSLLQTLLSNLLKLYHCMVIESQLHSSSIHPYLVSMQENLLLEFNSDGNVTTTELLCYEMNTNLKLQVSPQYNKLVHCSPILYNP